MYKLILMDYNMPILNGAEATNLIRNYLKKKKVRDDAQPFIACTTISTNKDIMLECEVAGVSTFAHKPIFKHGI